MVAFILPIVDLSTSESLDKVSTKSKKAFFLDSAVLSGLEILLYILSLCSLIFSDLVSLITSTMLLSTATLTSSSLVVNLLGGGLPST